MIGCIGYTTILECSQYVEDVFRIKALYLLGLILISLFLIYFSGTKNYKQLSKKYTSYKIMLIIPIWFSYITLFTALLGIGGLMSINLTLSDFMIYIWAIYIPAIAWVLLMLFYLGMDWLLQKLGFMSGKAFFKAVLKK